MSVQEAIKGSVGIKYVPGSEGLYELTYVPVVKGLYSLTITIGGSVIETDTTAGVFVVPARASGPHSTHDAQPIAIEDVTEPFTIQVCVALRVVPEGSQMGSTHLRCAPSLTRPPSLTFPPWNARFHPPLPPSHAHP